MWRSVWHSLFLPHRSENRHARTGSVPCPLQSSHNLPCLPHDRLWDETMCCETLYSRFNAIRCRGVVQILIDFLTSEQTFGNQVYLVRELWVQKHASDFLAMVDYKLGHFMPLLQVCTRPCSTVRLVNRPYSTASLPSLCLSTSSSFLPRRFIIGWDGTSLAASCED